MRYLCIHCRQSTHTNTIKITPLKINFIYEVKTKAKVFEKNLQLGIISKTSTAVYKHILQDNNKMLNNFNWKIS